MVRVRFSVRNIKDGYSVKWYDGTIKEISNTDDFVYNTLTLEEALITSGTICMLNREIIKSFKIDFDNDI